MPYDVLAVRAQREEASGAKPWPFTIGEDHFVLPAEPPSDLLPFLGDLAEHLDKAGPDGDLPVGIVTATPKIMLALLAPEDVERFSAHRLSILDVAHLLMAYISESLGGGGLGESSGSPTSSPPTPTTRKPTSKRSTGSRSSRTTAAKSPSGA